LVSIIAGLANFLFFYALVFFAELPRPAGLGLDIFSTGLALGPATLVMLVVGPVAGKAVTKIGPKPIMLTGSAVLVLGFLLLIINRSDTTYLTIDAAVSMAGIVSLIVPIVNMISVSLPKDTVGVGQAINNTLKSLGQAIGPILATAIMSSYTQPLSKVVNGQVITVGDVPSATAFNTIFIIGIAMTIVALGVTVFAKNYVFKKENSQLV
jgi:MFS family permease